MTKTPKVLGILGAGQLGAMLTDAAHDLGLRVAEFDPSEDAPGLKRADIAISAPFEDLEAAAKLADESDVVTLEWELIPAPTLAAVASVKRLYPEPKVLDVIRDRLTQREFLKANNFPQTEYGPAKSAADIPHYPVIVKRRTHGYDGKGQARLKNKTDAVAHGEIFSAPCVWESIVPFQKEISVILARTHAGVISSYPIAENVHRNGILHATRAPAEIPAKTAEAAVDLAERIAAALGHVGVMAVEMFVLADGRILVNEIAPRVHNSGHYTLGGCATSQFEQHVRAVCGLPLGDPTLKGPALMVNLMGEQWAHGEPNFSQIQKISGATLHLYGKTSARPGRKMGHYTVVGDAAHGEWARADARLASLVQKS